MSPFGAASNRPAALKASIREVESRIRGRRAVIDRAMATAARSAGRWATSPEALLAAGVFGAVMERDHHVHGVQLLAILQKTNEGLRLLLAETSVKNECQR